MSKYAVMEAVRFCIAAARGVLAARLGRLGAGQ